MSRQLIEAAFCRFCQGLAPQAAAEAPAEAAAEAAVATGLGCWYSWLDRRH